MTIIQPSKSFLRENLTAVFLAAAAVFSALFYVYQYNIVVSLRHELKSEGAEFSKVQVANSEFKNAFYQLVDSGNLENLAAERNLVLENKPEYLTGSRLWLSASQF